jgi:hypothetical protein
MDYLAAPFAQVSQGLALFPLMPGSMRAADLNKEHGHGVNDGTTARKVIKTVVSRSFNSEHPA